MNIIEVKICDMLFISIFRIIWFKCEFDVYATMIWSTQTRTRLSDTVNFQNPDKVTRGLYIYVCGYEYNILLNISIIMYVYVFMWCVTKGMSCLWSN